MSSRQLQNTIENPTLELKIVSANDINHIHATDKIDVYAVVSLDGDTTRNKQSAKTPIDYDGGSNPTWNHIVKFYVNEKEANEDLLTVRIKLYSYWLENENDLYMGEVNVSVHELLASNPLPPFVNGHVKKMKSLSYSLKLVGETKPNANLSLSYRFKPVPVHDLYPQPSAPPEYLPSFGQQVYSNLDPTRPSQPMIYSNQVQHTSQPVYTNLDPARPSQPMIYSPLVQTISQPVYTNLDPAIPSQTMIYSPPVQTTSQPVYTNPDPARPSQSMIYSPKVQTTSQPVYTNLDPAKSSQATKRTKLTLELVIISAKDIRNVNVFDDMDVYAGPILG